MKKSTLATKHRDKFYVPPITPTKKYKALFESNIELNQVQVESFRNRTKSNLVFLQMIGKKVKEGDFMKQKINCNK